MRIISRKRLRLFAQQHNQAARPLDQWYRTVLAAKWQNFHDLRRVYPHADLAKVASGSIVTIFDIVGNRFRLIAALHYNRQRVYVLRLLTHAEYSKHIWKESL